MNGIEQFWDLVSKLTFAEMLEIGERLRDTWDGESEKERDAYQWAQNLHWSRVGFDEYCEEADED